MTKAFLIMIGGLLVSCTRQEKDALTPSATGAPTLSSAPGRHPGRLPTKTGRPGRKPPPGKEYTKANLIRVAY